MIKRFAFPVFGLAMLAAAISLTPQAALAGEIEITACNEKFCQDVASGPDTCQPATHGPKANCLATTGSCTWQFCSGTEE